MTERLLGTAHGSYRLQEWDGRNGSGIQPVGDKVLVLVDPAADKQGSIHIPQDAVERQTLASTTGILIGLGETAFSYDGARLLDWVGARPEIGNRVFFQRYAGQEYTGLDGRMYRVLEDRSVAGIEAPQVAAEAVAATKAPRRKKSA